MPFPQPVYFWQLGTPSVQHDQLRALEKSAIIGYEVRADLHLHLAAVELTHLASSVTKAQKRVSLGLCQAAPIFRLPPPARQCQQRR